jgi:hypothetical protein
MVKNFILINFFTVKVAGYKKKGKAICNSSNDVISGNFDSEKVDQN